MAAQARISFRRVLTRFLSHNGCILEQRVEEVSAGGRCRAAMLE